jgi:hypothetical protein
MGAAQTRRTDAAPGEFQGRLSYYCISMNGLR